MDKKECPVCKNNEYFSCFGYCPNSKASIISDLAEKVSLNVCTECGCVYVDKAILNAHKKRKTNIQKEKLNI